MVADAGDAQSVRDMVSRGKVICTTVGPYQLYGNDIVAACVELGTDYVDLSGEPGWMHETIGAYNEQAAQSGARIVHSCGFDSIPFDLGVYYLQQAAREKFGKPFARVRGRVRAMNGEFSGGTALPWAQLWRHGKSGAFCATSIRFAQHWLYQPDQMANNVSCEGEAIVLWVAPFMMAAKNTKNIHRLNALLIATHGTDFNYDEMMITGAGEEGKKMAKFVAAPTRCGR